MTINEGTGIYGINSSSPTVAPKGIIGFIDGTNLPTTQCMGEMLGTQRAVTGGGSYSTRNTTSLTASYQAIFSVSLTTGIYLVAYSLSGTQSTTTVDLSHKLRLNSSDITSEFVPLTQNGVPFQYGLFGVPVYVSSGTQTLEVYAKLSSSVTVSSTQNELWIVRIA